MTVVHHAKTWDYEESVDTVSGPRASLDAVLMSFRGASQGKV